MIVATITDLDSEHTRRRRRRTLPADCFHCGSSVSSGDVYVPGSSGELWLHIRDCTETFGLSLLTLAEMRRRLNGARLRVVA